MPTFPSDPDDTPPFARPHHVPRPDNAPNRVMWKGVAPIMPLRAGDRLCQMIKFVTDQIEQPE